MNQCFPRQKKEKKISLKVMKQLKSIAAFGVHRSQSVLNRPVIPGSSGNSQMQLSAQSSEWMDTSQFPCHLYNVPAQFYLLIVILSPTLKRTTPKESFLSVSLPVLSVKFMNCTRTCYRAASACSWQPAPRCWELVLGSFFPASKPKQTFPIRGPNPANK